MAGDMELTSIALFVGWALGGVGVVTAPGKDAWWKAWGLLILAVVFFAEGLFLDRHFHSGESPSMAIGGSFQITTAAPQLSPNGLFDFPVAMRNNGDDSILNYSYWFGQRPTDKLLTIAEENKYFDEATKVFLEHLEEQKTPNIINLLKPGDTAVISQPKVHYDRDAFNRIAQGQEFVYDFVVVHYTDKKSIAERAYYIAEYCARRGVGLGMVPCQLHNFMKTPEHP
jgi:hypothetical protein